LPMDSPSGAAGGPGATPQGGQRRWGGGTLSALEKQLMGAKKRLGQCRLDCQGGRGAWFAGRAGGKRGWRIKKLSRLENAFRLPGGGGTLFAFRCGGHAVPCKRGRSPPGKSLAGKKKQDFAGGGERWAARDLDSQLRRKKQNFHPRKIGGNSFRMGKKKKFWREFHTPQRPNTGRELGSSNDFFFSILEISAPRPGEPRRRGDFLPSRSREGIFRTAGGPHTHCSEKLGKPRESREKVRTRNSSPNRHRRENRSKAGALRFASQGTQ